MKQIPLVIVRGVSSFFRWWIAELRSVGEDIRSHLAPRWRKRLTVYVSDSHLTLVDGDSPTDPQILEVTRDASKPTAPFDTPVDGLVGALRGRRARLIFSPQLAFIRQLQMPVAVLPHLATAIELQLPKLLPLDPQALRSDFEVTAVEPQAAIVTVDLAAIRNSDAEPVEQVLQSWGLHSVSLQLGERGDTVKRFKFATSDTAAARLNLSRTDLTWAGSAAALAVAAIAVFTVQSVRAHQSLQLALLQTRMEAAAVLENRQQLLTRLDTLAFLAQNERAPSAAAVLSEVTARLNRDSWLTTFELKGRELRLLGLSPEPAAAVKDLANSSLITDVELRSSASSGTAGGKERFEITARVKAP